MPGTCRISYCGASACCQNAALASARKTPLWRHLRGLWLQHSALYSAAFRSLLGGLGLSFLDSVHPRPQALFSFWIACSCCFNSAGLFPAGRRAPAHSPKRTTPPAAVMFFPLSIQIPSVYSGILCRCPALYSALLYYLHGESRKYITCVNNRIIKKIIYILRGKCIFTFKMTGLIRLLAFDPQILRERTLFTVTDLQK